MSRLHHGRLRPAGYPRSVTSVTRPLQRLERPQWRELEAAHEAAVDELTGDHLERRRTGRSHPIEDFLFVYYRYRPAQLRRWHPGAGVLLAGDDPSSRGSWPYYTHDADGTFLDLEAYLAKRGDTVRFVHDLLVATESRPPRLSCFGLHEWAMVHGLQPGEKRHESLPLRLTQEQTDAVVESSTIRCSHFDAFRFFTPTSRPMNTLCPARETQVENEQPGCLHATMDLYKWATKLGPAVPGSLLLDTFRLARRARELDMQASPYDVSDLGYAAIPVETPEGRAAYAIEQRAIIDLAAPIRARMIAVCADLLAV